MTAALSPEIGLVHICNPNNPTGMVLDGDDLRGFIRKSSGDATILIDEAYNELTDKPEYSSVVDLVKEGHDIIVCRTFSKIYGMAGMRVGYAITSPENAEKIRGYLMSFGGNTSGLAAAIASLNDIGFTRYSKNRIVEARSSIMDTLDGLGMEVLPSQTNFLYVKVPDADTVQAQMAQRDIMIRGSYGDQWKNWSRVSTGKIEDVERYNTALIQLFGT
jgi:histidinol-phosphate aminotransferase